MIIKSLVAVEKIEEMIFLIRNTKVMVDRDLAELYGVSTKRLNEQVKRNIKRFPPDFMFRLNKSETAELVANCDRFKALKHSTTNPHVFTEQGVSMLSSVLNSEKAIDVNVQVMRAFVKIREMILTHKDLSMKIANLEKKYDKQFAVVFEAIRELIEMPKKDTRKIGF